ncbi:putative sodium-dependent transporter YhdH [Kurthia zopfii]|uniref:NSS family neurotransmitter:Na+ symporter n=1 Tax=Kurthia zopfii TaxID=1650 RepID=A0A8B4QCF5_9BACL|nr:sodium-dependent transporter [Kurthia zopfii]PWI23579.1 sodium-dependent transporter [Kurthia zopfii]TDR42742.1 NSS family neurotransmitter:Na+ symporter [Kurthia zopfii]GEK30215.1 putative sodium-dependent transporter YhdH [Kurthia zopfii]STX10421.1 Na+-dependent transporters of the SNF family [Kurthia zopfii]
MSNRDQFASKIGFILAAAGSAIGLGAIWKFPYMAGTNGGSVFILLFILCTLVIGLPILVAEFMIGRRGKSDAVTSFKKQAPGKPWFLTGWMGFIFSAIILSFYSVVGGWILSYLIRSVSFRLSSNEKDFFANLFTDLTMNTWEVIIAQGAFLLIIILIISSGIQNGVEKASKWMMPLLFIFFVILAIRSLTLDGAMDGVKFMFVPDWSYLTGKTFLLALGQAFFSLSVGVAAMLTYASYLKKEVNLGSSALNVAWMNIGISILAGLVIFPAVFALGFTPNQGPGLVFIIIPAVFQQIPFGSIFVIFFFILLLFATITSAIAMLEIVVATAMGDKYNQRKKFAWICGIGIFIIGIPSALSFGILSDVKIFGRSIFDFADFVTSSIGMPIGALLVAIFAGYQLKRAEQMEELPVKPWIFNIWRILVRYVAPIAIIIVFIQGFRN